MPQNKLSLLFIFSFFYGNLFAQEVQILPKNKLLKNTISFNATFEGEAFIIYERYLDKLNSIEIRYGYKNGNKTESSWTNKTDQARFYSGNIFQVGYRRYLNSRDDHKHQWYVSPELMLKDYSFDHVQIDHINGGNETCQIRSSHKQVYAFKAVGGRKLYFGTAKGVSFILDAYIGIGVRNRIFNDNIFAEGSSNPDQTSQCIPLPLLHPLTEKTSDINFTVHTGILIGIAF